MTLVTMVLCMTNNQDQDSDQNLRTNLRRELKTLERRRAYANSINVGKGAVLYFGPYLGFLLVFIGIMDLFDVVGFVKLSIPLLISLTIMIVGTFVVVASLFTARVVIPLEVQPRE